MDLSYLQQAAMIQRSVLKISPDGYIRLSFATFSALPFVHLFSECDELLQHELQSQTIPANFAGFSECVSATTPAISLGWAWYIENDTDSLLLAPEPVRSNVMIIDMQGYDLGVSGTANLIGEWLQHFDWQAMVKLALRVPVFAGHNNMLGNVKPC